MNNTRIVELVIDEDSQELAIDAISLVSAPAIEENWVFFGKEKNNLTLAKVDEEKRMLVSPALIPNKQIFRYDPNTDSDYYVYFSPETVRKASELYLKHNNHHKATYEHQDRVSGILTVESWIIEDTKTDKSTLYGFSLPKGTWMVKMKIENDDLWQKIKSGELKGLSIEGYFTNKFEQMQKTKPTTEQILSAFNELVKEGKITTMSKAKRIDLSLAGDIKGVVDRLNNVDNESMDIVTESGMLVKEIKGFLKDRKSEVEKKLKKINLAIKELGTLQDKAQGLEKTVNKAANELGIDQNEIPGYEDLIEYANDADDTIGDLQEVKGELDKISMNL